MPSPVGGLWACPQKKNQFCAKNYAILGKFWYFFPTLQQKVGVYPPVLKVGDLPPCPPAPTPMVCGLLGCVSSSIAHRFSSLCVYFGMQLSCLRSVLCVSRSLVGDVSIPHFVQLYSVIQYQWRRNRGSGSSMNRGPRAPAWGHRLVGPQKNF